MKLLIPIMAPLILLSACQTCRVTSCEDAFEYEAKGYQTRIAIYPVGLDGKLWGAFLRYLLHLLPQPRLPPESRQFLFVNFHRAPRI